MYIGVTNSIERRVYEHKNNIVPGFTNTYLLHHLVYVEETTDVNTALAREKQLKHWNRAWKIKLIEKDNPTWSDLL